MDQRRMEQLETQMGELAKAFGGLDKTVAVLASVVQTVADNVKDAQREREDLRVQVRGIGEKTLSLGNDVKDLSRTAGELKSVVQGLRDDHLRETGMVTGATSTGTWIVRILWIAGAAVLSWIAGVATWFGLVKPHVPPS